MVRIKVLKNEIRKVFVMNLWWILLLIGAMFGDVLLRKKLPDVYRKIQLPLNIISSVLIAVYIVFYIYCTVDVIGSDVATSNKIFFVIFMGLTIAVFVVAWIRLWTKWCSERKKSTTQNEHDV